MLMITSCLLTTDMLHSWATIPRYTELLFSLILKLVLKWSIVFCVCFCPISCGGIHLQLHTHSLTGKPSTYHVYGALFLRLQYWFVKLTTVFISFQQVYSPWHSSWSAVLCLGSSREQTGKLGQTNDWSYVHNFEWQFGLIGWGDHVQPFPNKQGSNWVSERTYFCFYCIFRLMYGRIMCT